MRGGGKRSEAYERHTTSGEGIKAVRKFVKSGVPEAKRSNAIAIKPRLE